MRGSFPGRGSRGCNGLEVGPVSGRARRAVWWKGVRELGKGEAVRLSETALANCSIIGVTGVILNFLAVTFKK